MKNTHDKKILSAKRDRGFVPPSTRQAGFALLFTVVIVSLILSIALGISNVTFKQTLLSSLAKDSGVAFYQADTAMECGLYQDLELQKFVRDTAEAPQNFTCGNIQMTKTDNLPNYYMYIQDDPDPNLPCFTLVFDKQVENVIEARGYNFCEPTPRQVERALEVRY